MKDLNKMFKPDSVAVIRASNTPGKSRLYYHR